MLYKISKRQARKRYIDGKAIVLCPSKMHPFGAWRCGHTTTRQEEPEGENYEADFNTLCQSFDWYNCSKEAGLRVAFYLPEGEHPEIKVRK